jgi:hypothetical protein
LLHSSAKTIYPSSRRPLQIEKQYVFTFLCVQSVERIGRRYRFAVKAVEHAQVRTARPLPPAAAAAAFSDAPTDLLEPAREDPPARFEAHKVNNQTKTSLSLPGARFTLFVGGRYDDEIYEHTLREFPEFATAPHASLVALDEEWMKSKEGKERWRTFINACVCLSFSRLVQE